MSDAVAAATPRAVKRTILAALVMRRAPGPLIDVREGETRPAVRSFLLLALIIAGHTMLETARDALFLSKLPASRLALVYALIAGLALVVAAPNARFVRRFGESRALLWHAPRRGVRDGAALPAAVHAGRRARDLRLERLPRHRDRGAVLDALGACVHAVPG